MRPPLLLGLWLMAACQPPEPPPVPVPATTFPVGRIASWCGVALQYGALPEALLDDRWQTFGPLEHRALRIEVCGARTRAEVAMATTRIGQRLLEQGAVDDGLSALRHAADTWYEPMAHIELGMVYLEGDHVPADPGRAWRYLAAGQAIADDIAARTGDDGLSRLVAHRIGDGLATFDQPRTRRRFDRRTAAASTGRFVDARIAAYREVYVGPGYAAAR